jgi:hypothetical protein
MPGELLTLAMQLDRQDTVRTPVAPMTDRRELYRSPNGDSWFLGREPTDGRAFIIHQPNAPSGGRLSHIELGEFLRLGNGPEQQALLRLIATLVEIPPFAHREADPPA